MDTPTAPMVPTELRVRYAETDAMGVVYYANYLVWFELGRTTWIRQFGVSYRSLEEAGILLPVTHVACDYQQSASYDDRIQIQTTLERYSRASIAFAYRVVRTEPGPPTVLATGRSEHVFLSREGKIVRLSRESPFWQALLVAVGESTG